MSVLLLAGLRGLLARLAAAGPPGSAHRQAAAVLGQQLEVALQGAAVPPCRTQLVEAAARWGRLCPDGWGSVFASTEAAAPG